MGAHRLDTVRVASQPDLAALERAAGVLQLRLRTSSSLRWMPPPPRRPRRLRGVPVSRRARVLAGRRAAGGELGL